ncbi:hypothetical protein J8J42_07860 [Chryseobacterium sp. cx-311]|uniref:DUF6520 family protein n=1 Tax=Marnyiella aurantia TaxID=2758037 RepID=UPI001AE8D0DD|nr:DUF6520 family protein [Marnyiella aurantia]MBP0612959.1 hypothetical protein [Marnyiella aurantia]
MKKLILPVALVVTAAGGAFATQANTAKNATVVPAYRMDPVSGLCVYADQECSTINGPVCTWNVDNVTPLHSSPLSPTECGAELFKIQ